MSEETYQWRKQREKNSFIALEDGTILRGISFGAEIDNVGEVVFNTGMTGYQEILSDPSYSGQFVTMTYPQIGNTGINADDMESKKAFLNALVIHELNSSSNWRSEETLTAFLEKNKIPAICGIDTRALTHKIRLNGTLKAFIHCSNQALTPEEAVAKARDWEGLDNQDYAAKVTCDKSYKWDPSGEKSGFWDSADSLPKIKYNVVAFDFGIKWNILRSMRQYAMEVNVVPASTPAEDVISLRPDAVFFSNGPADPAAVSYAIDTAKTLIGKIPIMGICLGHQILGIASGADRVRLKFGHHGCNHPVQNLSDNSVEITSQNHNFALDRKTLPSSLELTHINLNDQTVEGIKHRSEPMFSIQYHPEACPGPRDPEYLFRSFAKLIDDNK